jgi:hypothetical protein
VVAEVSQHTMPGHWAALVHAITTVPAAHPAAVAAQTVDTCPPAFVAQHTGIAPTHVVQS